MFETKLLYIINYQTTRDNNRNIKKIHIRKHNIFTCLDAFNPSRIPTYCKLTDIIHNDIVIS